MATVKLTIDSREIMAQPDRRVLDLARDMGIEIPSLCHHRAVEPYGACRLCVVEVRDGGAPRLASSCDLVVREGMEIRTDTPAVRRSRRLTLELLWARAPQAPVLQRLAAEMGLERPRFAARDRENKCILCGLCVRVCEKLIGAEAIGYAHRGQQRQVATAFDKASELCVGCGACAAVCPTGHVRQEDRDAQRRMITWRTQLNLRHCPRCGRGYVPQKQVWHMREMIARWGENAELCPRCRRRATAGRVHVAAK